MFNNAVLSSTFATFGLHPTEGLFTELKEAYSEPGRFYHTVEHVTECLNALSRCASHAEQPAEISLAIWFHDAIYDAHRSDNEERSADWAALALKEVEAPSSLSHRIFDLILATKTHQAKDSDCALLLDIDLGILGASPAAFERYDQNIRKEYSWVPEAQYQTARAQVLQSFLERPRIYQTEVIRSELEAQARLNLSASLARLRAQG